MSGTVKTHVEKYEEIDPEFVSKVLRHFYVDDFNCGVESYEHGIELYKKVKIRFINWKFNVEKAPWWGGKWERLASCVKRCIKKVVATRTITYIELRTIVQEIEVTLNNRPIDVDYDDDKEDILSPSHLIFGRQLSTTNMSTQNSDSNLNLSKRKKML